MQNERESLECGGRLTALIPEACRVPYLLCAPVVEVLHTRNWSLKVYTLPTIVPRAMRKCAPMDILMVSVV